jgi:hypothetical protein
MRRRHAWFFLLGALAACSSQDRTRLAVTVYSDLLIPTEIDTLRIEVQGPTGLKQVDYALAAQTTQGKYTLPVQTILVPQGGKEDAFTVTAIGIKDRGPVITRNARLSFLPGEARELIIFLNRDCYQRTCAGNDQTCVAGVCVPNTVNPKNLPTYTTNVKGTSTSTTTRTGDAAAGEANDVDGGSEAGSAPLGDAHPLSDASRDLPQGETGNTADAPELIFDADPNTLVSPSPDAPLPETDAPPSSGHDSGPILPGPDGAIPDSKPAADTTGVTVTDTALLPDTPQPSPDTASVLPDTPPLSPDAPVDVPCPPSCTVGAQRCDNNAVQTCGTLTNGCIGWGSDHQCGLRQLCEENGSTAECKCQSTNSAHCPIPGGTTGKFCEGTELLQACTQDTDGCYYVVLSQTCTTAQPCSGVDGSASCSCSATPAPCDAAPKAGTYCLGTNQVYSCSYASGCMVATPVGDTCPSDMPCEQTGLYVAECKCPTVPECDSSEEINQSYCSLNTAITCDTTPNGCQQVSKVDCKDGQVCKKPSDIAACECINKACLTSGGVPFSDQACDDDARVLTCGTVNACPGITATNTCATGTVCRASAGVAQCMPTLGWYTDFGGTGSRGSSMLIGHQVLLTVRSRLVKFGLIARASASAVMALYADGGSLVASNQSPITADRNEFAPATSTILDPGRYWIMANYSATVDVAQKAGSSVERRSISHTYGAALPPNLTGASTVTGTQSNLYIVLLPE